MPAIPAWPPRSAPRLFVEAPLEEEQVRTLDTPQAHYLARVMRVGEGDAVILCDDVTGEWAAHVIEVTKRSVALRVAKCLRPREQVPDLWLCPALIRKDRFDLVLEKATELGARAIRPVITRRCVADSLNLDRSRKIVTEAAEQCARTALPELFVPVPVTTLLADWPADRTLFFADEEGGEPASEAFGGGRDTADRSPAAILIGPEGGFDAAERRHIRALDQSRPITLGPRILRAETAAISAVALWMNLAGDVAA